MDIGALADIDEVDIEINPLEAARGDQALHDADILHADFRPVEQSVINKQSLRKGKVYGPVRDGNFL
jgi:hypothetical protein